MTKLTLISTATCPYVQRAIITLNEKRATYETKYVDLAAKPDWFLATSPLGKVPVLKVEREGKPDAAIFESLVIVEFAEETVPGPRLHPDDPVEKAQHRAWMEFGSGMLLEVYRIWIAKDEEGYRAACETVTKRLQRLEEVLGAGPYFAGEEFSCVDTVFAPLFGKVDATEAMASIGLLKGFPKVAAWSKALARRPSVRNALPENHAEIFATALNLKESYFMKFAEPAGA